MKRLVVVVVVVVLTHLEHVRDRPDTCTAAPNYGSMSCGHAISGPVPVNRAQKIPPRTLAMILARVNLRIRSPPFHGKTLKFPFASVN